MNNNSIEFKKKYLKYKHKYITLKDQLFFTYDTKIKQIGGVNEFVCIIDDEGLFDSFEECYGTPKPTISYDTRPSLKLWQDWDKGNRLNMTDFGCELAHSDRLQTRADPKNNRRRDILLTTLERFAQCTDGLYYHRLAFYNLIRWAANKQQMSTDKKCIVTVVEDDWGVAAQRYTIQYGKCFAVLNMANGSSPGGGYTSGAAAQEENMFRRTDCHFSLRRNNDTIKRDPASKCKWRYTTTQSDLINGVNGFVYLDMDKARVCIRGPEDYTARDLGYPWLKENEVFPFYELRAAAVNLSKPGSTYNHTETRKRIAAQLDTLKVRGVRHVVLSAFGCGAFKNPPKEVALAYYQELMTRRAYFDVVVFAIFFAGSGQSNYQVFHTQFSTWNVS